MNLPKNPDPAAGRSAPAIILPRDRRSNNVLVFLIEIAKHIAVLAGSLSKAPRDFLASPTEKANFDSRRALQLILSAGLTTHLDLEKNYLVHFHFLPLYFNNCWACSSLVPVHICLFHLAE